MPLSSSFFPTQVGSLAGNRGVLNEASQAGYFSPFGSPRLRALRRRKFLQNSAAARAATGGYGRLIGLDPQSQRQLMTQATLGANANLAGGLNEGELQDQASNVGFFRNLYGSELDYQRQRQMQRDAQKAASRGGVGQFLGSVAGAFLPGVGGLFKPSGGAGSYPYLGQPGYNPYG